MPLVTATGALLGSPHFMSPEQLKSSRDVDARSDVWALGVTLYELVTGALPFEAPSLVELSASVLLSPPRPMLSLRPDVPPKLEALILKCLEKAPGARFGNVGELAAALEWFAPPGRRSSAERVRTVLSSRRMLDSLPAPAIAPGAMESAPTVAEEPRVSTGSLTSKALVSTLSEAGRAPSRAPHWAWIAAALSAVVVASMAFVVGTRPTTARTVAPAAAPSALAAALPSAIPAPAMSAEPATAAASAAESAAPAPATPAPRPSRPIKAASSPAVRSARPRPAASARDPESLLEERN